MKPEFFARSRGGGRRPSRPDGSLLGHQETPMIVNRETGLSEVGSSRSTVHQSTNLHIENSSLSASEPAPSGFETRYQVILPYFGLFEYHVGHQSCQVDTACTLFVTPQREYFDVHPIAGLGHAGIIINLAEGLVDEVMSDSSSGSAFDDMVRPANHRLKLLTHHMLRTFHPTGDQLRAQELALATILEAFETKAKGTPRRSGVVEKAKLLLHSRECERLSLEEIAQGVGVSAIYLTQEFTRTEGIPLYRYQLQLRMNRALLELPHCNDITHLALDLGFYSHSHFTATFRRHFGLTPSEYRRGLPIDEAVAHHSSKQCRAFFRRGLAAN